MASTQTAIAVPGRRLLWQSILGIAAAITVGAVGLGSEEFEGTFGVTQEPRSCGSVWTLPGVTDLNAATCVDDLRSRLTLVAVMLGVAGASAATAAFALGRMRSTKWLGVTLLGSVAAAAAAMIVVGRHLIWSVSGA